MYGTKKSNELFQYIFSIFILKLTKLLGKLLENFKKLLIHLNNFISKEIV